MTLITNAPSLPGEEPFPALVSIELIDDTRRPITGYVPGTGATVQRRLQFRADGNNEWSDALGEWAVDLVPNAWIGSLETVYRVTEQHGRSVAAVHLIEVPEAGGPFTVLDVLVETPGQQLVTHLEDVDGAHAASAVSFVPAGGLASTDVQDALIELDAQDTTEAAARVAGDAAVAADLVDEAGTREAADDALAAAVLAEAVTREADDDALAAALAAHAAATVVHGVDTDDLVLDDDSRLADTRVPTDGSVTGGAPGAGVKLAANTIVDANVAPGAAIAQSKIDGLPTALSDEAAARAAADTAETNARLAHEADTTGVHGIADTTQLVVGSDARLSDQRVPTANSVDQTKVVAGSLGIDRLAVDPRAWATHSGTQTADTISDLTTAVRTNGLDQMAAPAAPVDLAGQRLINGSLPLADTDLITKEYADALRAGLLLKADPVRVMIDTNVNINAPGAVLDSIALDVDDGVLLTGQTSANDNGIYLYKGSAVPMVRRSDADTSEEMRSGTAVWVLEGTFEDERWVLLSGAPIVLGVTDQVWSFDGGLAHLVAGDGLTKTGHRVDVVAGFAIEVLADEVGVELGNFVGPSASVAGPTAGDIVGSLKVVGDAFDRLRFLADGTIRWVNQATGATLVDLFRASSGALEISGTSAGLRLRNVASDAAAPELHFYSFNGAGTGANDKLSWLLGIDVAAPTAARDFFVAKAIGTNISDEIYGSHRGTLPSTWAFGQAPADEGYKLSVVAGGAADTAMGGLKVQIGGTTTANALALKDGAQERVWFDSAFWMRGQANVTMASLQVKADATNNLRTLAMALGDGSGVFGFEHNGSSFIRFRGFSTATNIAQFGGDGTTFLYGALTMNAGATLQGGNLTIQDNHLVLGSSTGTKIGTAASQKLGFFNAAPIVQPSGVPAAADDLATVIALANDIRTKLLALGLAAA